MRKVFTTLATSLSVLASLASTNTAHAGIEKAEIQKPSTFWEDHVTLRAILHPQFDFLQSDLNEADEANPPRSERLFFRRFMLGAKVRLSERVRINYITDLNDWEVNNHIARLEWAPNKNDLFYLGYQKAPFGFEDTSSSTKVKPIERSANTRFWNEVIGIGSYHSGVYYTRKLDEDLTASFGLTHNVKSQSDWPDVFDGDVSLYARLHKKGEFSSGATYDLGTDLAHQEGENGNDISALSVFYNFSYQTYNYVLEATTGEIGLPDGDVANATGWHAQVSKPFAEVFEWVVRASKVDTGGAPLKLSSAIRKAPYSGYKYENVDSLYLGVNYLFDDNNIKLSCGYELAEGRNALSGPGALESISETITGFRIRGQFLF